LAAVESAFEEVDVDICRISELLCEYMCLCGTVMSIIYGLGVKTARKIGKKTRSSVSVVAGWRRSSQSMNI
jgi:hypothetical protein